MQKNPEGKKRVSKRGKELRKLVGGRKKTYVNFRREILGTRTILLLSLPPE